MPTSAVPVTSRHARPRRLASIPTDSWETALLQS